jgi:hypothetical protein
MSLAVVVATSSSSCCSMAAIFHPCSLSRLSLPQPERHHYCYHEAHSLQCQQHDGALKEATATASNSSFCLQLLGSPRLQTVADTTIKVAMRCCWREKTLLHLMTVQPLAALLSTAELFRTILQSPTTEREVVFTLQDLLLEQAAAVLK